MTAAAVAPGALVLGWAATIAGLDLSVGLTLGWVPGCLAAALISTIAFWAVEYTPARFRTPVAFAIGICANAAYVVALWHYIRSMN